MDTARSVPELIRGLKSPPLPRRSFQGPRMLHRLSGSSTSGLAPAQTRPPPAPTPDSSAKAVPSPAPQGSPSKLLSSLPSSSKAPSQDAAVRASPAQPPCGEFSTPPERKPAPGPSKKMSASSKKRPGAAAPRRPAASNRRRRCADILGRRVNIPTTVFGVKLREIKYYTGRVVSLDARRRDSVVVHFPNEDPPKYWFPEAAVREWLRLYGPKPPEPRKKQQKEQVETIIYSPGREAADVLTTLSQRTGPPAANPAQ
uniref:Uncharacterized protein n=1 Tax=Auxenochlorella protothecoides TaxID=3075 RepID=A0A1D1ZUA8_AUXPR